MLYRHRDFYRKMINSGRWRATRAMVLQRDRGLCVDCAACRRYTIATEVHHVRPVEWERTRGAMSQLMFDPANLVSLCHDCHRLRHAELASSDREKQKERAEIRLLQRYEELTKK